MYKGSTEHNTLLYVPREYVLRNTIRGSRDPAIANVEFVDHNVVRSGPFWRGQEVRIMLRGS